MNKNEWHEKYIKTLMDKGWVQRKVAEECLQGAIDDFEYDESPEDAALEELSYWAEGY